MKAFLLHGGTSALLKVHQVEKGMELAEKAKKWNSDRKGAKEVLSDLFISQLVGVIKNKLKNSLEFVLDKLVFLDLDLQSY